MTEWKTCREGRGDPRHTAATRAVVAPLVPWLAVLCIAVITAAIYFRN